MTDYLPFLAYIAAGVVLLIIIALVYVVAISRINEDQ